MLVLASAAAVAEPRRARCWRCMFDELLLGNAVCVVGADMQIYLERAGLRIKRPNFFLFSVFVFSKLATSCFFVWRAVEISQ